MRVTTVNVHLDEQTMVEVWELEKSGLYTANFGSKEGMYCLSVFSNNLEQLKELTESMLTQIEQLKAKKESVSA